MKMNNIFHKLLKRYNKISLYVISLILSYVIAFLLISLVWYVYELIILGHLNQNKEDSITAFMWSLILMVPIYLLFLWDIKKKLNK